MVELESGSMLHREKSTAKGEISQRNIRKMFKMLREV